MGKVKRVLRSLARALRRPVLWLPLLFLLTFGTGVAWGSWQNLCVDCPSIAQIQTWEPQQTSKVFSHDGTLITEIGYRRRTPVSIEDLPPHVPQAFIAVEDRRFYSHGGVDPRGVARAVYGLATGQSGRTGGGSTLTQQLARNMFEEEIGYERRITRKLKEMQVAFELERVYSKDQILEAYINQVYYGRGYGIQTAARNYFGKNATELNPAESAFLAAVVNNPGRYNPYTRPGNARERRNLVLELMAQQGYLTREEAERWKAHPLPTEDAEWAQGEAPYFEEWVRQILDDRFGSKLYTDGLRVHTTLDVRMQRIAREEMERQWAAIEAEPAFRHPTYEEHADREEPFEGGQTPYLQGVFIALDPVTGHVRAMVGGRDFEQSKFNRAVQARRQAGSSFKPFVYASAIASGIPPSHIVVDAPVVYEQPGGNEWKPRNFDGQFRGPMTLRDGLRLSINMVAIRLGVEEVGLETVAQTAQRMGIRTEIERFPSTTIGASEVIPLQLAEAYSAFATLGTRVRPFPIVRVEDAEGQVLWEPQPERTQVLDSLVARVMVDMMRDVVDRGTGSYAIRRQAGLPYEVPAAGKTGTTNDATDVWFTGYTPNLLALVWFGMDRPQQIFRGAQGGRSAGPVWGRFARRVYYGSDGAEVAEDGASEEPILEVPEAWPMLSGLVTRMVDSQTGLLASEWCPEEDAYRELFISGTEPTEPCDRFGPGFLSSPGLDGYIGESGR